GDVEADLHRVPLHLDDAQHRASLAFAFGDRRIDLNGRLAAVELVGARLNHRITHGHGPSVPLEGDLEPLDRLLGHRLAVPLLCDEVPRSLDLLEDIVALAVAAL